MSLWRFVLIAFALACGSLEGAEPGVYYPGRDWRQSTPEAQGLDSAVLAHMVESISQKNPNVHSVTVLRHGYMVMDAYFYPYRSGELHDAASMTKSITSALVGIAIDKGLLSTDQRVLSFFPAEAPKEPEPAKKQMTVDDLLTMRTGMDCGVKPGEQELAAMRRAENMVFYALSIPMITTPGTKFSYCSPGFHLLSSIVTAVTHEPEIEFGRANLFSAIGIKEVVWPPDKQNRTHGWGDIHLYPHDFARIGYLYLHSGGWNGRQVISSGWVRRTTAVHTSTGRSGADYGYGWWLYPDKKPSEFGANGRGGQRIAVWPEKDMVVVVTGGGYSGDPVLPAVASAIKSDAALPENATGVESLRNRIREAAKAPAAEGVSPAPSIGSQISGINYELPQNPSTLERIGLQFDSKTRSEARVNLRYRGQDVSIPVGLDGVYRIGPNGPLHLLAGARGRWTSGSEFLLDVNFISNINHYALAMRFSGDSVDIAMNESSGLVHDGHVTEKRQ